MNQHPDSPAALAAAGLQAGQAVCIDSRKVTPGAAFFAADVDSTRRQQHISAAKNAGASAIVSAHDDGTIRVQNVRRAYAWLLAERSGAAAVTFPILGITGTSGKTTTAEILRHCLGSGAARVGTLGWHDGGKDRYGTHTTPPSEEVHAFLTSLPASCPGLAIEISSHAGDQHRMAGLPLAALAFTNLTSDHLDYHQTRAAYLQAKLAICEGLHAGSFVIVNADDPASADFRAAALARGVVPDHIIGIGFHNGEARLASLGSNEWKLAYRQRTYALTVPLPGDYNALNAAQAVFLATAAGIPIETALERLSIFPGVPGRVERCGEHPIVIVDYAHKTDAVQNVLGMLRGQNPSRLIAVLGCGGDRDRSKRPLMARAALIADQVVITADNPRSENPAIIAEEMLAGISSTDRHRVQVELDRARAIDLGCRLAGPDGLVAVLGKGHETDQIVAGKVLPWDDRAYCRGPQPWTLSPEIAENLTGGTWHGPRTSIDLRGAALDSRIVKPGMLFCCIAGAKVDGHNFISQAIQQGARLILANRTPSGDMGVPVLIVPDTTKALQQFALFFRRSFSQALWIGIAGANGKTTVKTMLASVLSPLGQVHATQGNLNNHLGVPLTILNTPAQAKVCVIELGGNHPGEIDELAALVRPNIGILTSVGAAHLEGYGSLEGMARSEAAVFHHASTRNYYNHTGLENLVGIQEANRLKALVTAEAKDLRVQLLQMPSAPTNCCGVVFPGKSSWPQVSFTVVDHPIQKDVQNLQTPSGSCQLRVHGAHHVANAALVWRVATDAGVDGAVALKLLSQVEPVHGRMRRVELGSHVLFDDAYNANPSSMLAALEELARQPGRRLAVLGRMGELGPTSAEWHQKMGAVAARLNLELLSVASSEILEGFQKAGGTTGTLAPDLASALQNIRERLKTAEANTLLIKASHSAGLHSLVANLVPGGPNGH